VRHENGATSASHPQEKKRLRMGTRIRSASSWRVSVARICPLRNPERLALRVVAKIAPTLATRFDSAVVVCADSAESDRFPVAAAFEHAVAAVNKIMALASEPARVKDARAEAVGALIGWH